MRPSVCLCCLLSVHPLPLQQANKAGVDEGLMLDPQGFVATCNSVNFFIVREGEVRRVMQRGWGLAQISGALLVR
jgi:branched-subunit amino acid aminotransferase/4-amino-4-deoxychorismate lyase